MWYQLLVLFTFLLHNSHAVFRLQASDMCNSGIPSAGPCIEGLCPQGLVCEGNNCCPPIGPPPQPQPQATPQPRPQPQGTFPPINTLPPPVPFTQPTIQPQAPFTQPSTVIGQPKPLEGQINGVCPQPGAASVCICGGGGLCPQLTICIQPVNVCCMNTVVQQQPLTTTTTTTTLAPTTQPPPLPRCPTTGQPPVGLCSNVACPPGFDCIFGLNICCATPPTLPPPTLPPPTFPPPTFPAPTTVPPQAQQPQCCADGRPSYGSCNANGQCPTGCVCERGSNLCCSPPPPRPPVVQPCTRLTITLRIPCSG